VATREPRGRRSRDAIYRQLAEAADELRTRLSGLPAPVEAQDIWGDIWYQEAHHSTAIEGNTLVLREVEILLVEGRAVGEKQLAEYLEVRGYADAAEWVYQQGLSSGDWTTGDLVTLTEIRHIHALAMSTVWEVAPHPDASPSEGPGSFRQHNIRPFPGGMQPPDWPDVPARMSDWVRTASELRTAAGPFPEALAQVHAEFERIHPFLDGNGRAGRLLTNLLLIRMGYAPAILRKAERTRYLAALRRSDAGTTRPSPSCWRAPYSTPSCASSCRRWRVRGEWFRWPPSPRVISRLAAGGRRAGTPSRPARRARSVAEHSKLGHPVSQEPLPARGVARSSSR